MDLLTGYGSDSGDENKSNDEQEKEATYEPIKFSTSLALKVCSAPEVVSTVRMFPHYS